MKHWLLVPLVLALGCGTVLRKPEVYRLEVDFFELVTEHNVGLLKQHLETCSCDAQLQWSSPLCADTAEAIVVLEARLAWHVANMRYLGRLSKTAPAEQEPEIPDSSVLCPETVTP